MYADIVTSLDKLNGNYNTGNIDPPGGSPAWSQVAEAFRFVNQIMRKLNRLWRYIAEHGIII
jgi:hypothetical protein